tara:strand:+ start:574 stop:1893 length:1320 start_codon:yes stop_codon:yes gene_type:complete
MFSVVGSNILAWITAIRLKQKYPKEEVTLINFGPNMGGNSRSFEFKNQFIDYGMQTYYETGIQWADDIVKDSLGLMEIKYNKFEWPNHDISKSFQNGRVSNSIFPEINIGNWSIEKLKDELTKSNNEFSLKDYQDDLEMYYKERYGNLIWEKIKKIAEKFTNSESLDNLSQISLAPLPLDRINVPEVSDFQLLQEPSLWNLIAFKESSNIPKKLYKNVSTIYPTEGGIYSLILALHSFASSLGIKIILNAKEEIINLKKSSLQIEGKKEQKVFWCIPNKLFQQSLETDLGIKPKPFNGSFVAFAYDGGTLSKNLHYLLSYEDDPIFRITFYRGLVGERSKEFGSIELLSSVDEYDEIFLIKRLEEMGVIDDKNKISFSEIKFSPWPITFQQGYKYQCKQVEDEIKSKFKNVILMNSNPINSSIMQTPTLTHRLQSEILK